MYVRNGSVASINKTIICISGKSVYCTWCLCNSFTVSRVHVGDVSFGNDWDCDEDFAGVTQEPPLNQIKHNLDS